MHQKSALGGAHCAPPPAGKEKACYSLGMLGGKVFAPLCAFAFAVALAASAAATSHLSDDPRVNEARRLVENNRHRDALLLLRPSVQEQKTQSHRFDALFLIGLAAKRLATTLKLDNEERQALFDEAIAAFQQILVEQPALLRARLELAHAHFLRQDDAAARRNFELALAAAPPPAMVANIHRFLHAIRQRRRWTSYFSMALAPSDNINNGTDNRVINLFGIPFNINESSRPKSGTGLLLRLGGEYKQPITPRLNWRLGAQATRQEYRKSNFDSTALSFNTGPAYFLSQASEVKAQALAGQGWAAKKRQYRFHGLRLQGFLRPRKRWQVSASSTWQKYTYRNSPNSNGLYSSYSARANHFFSPSVLLYAEGVYSVARPRAVSSRYNGWRVRPGVSFSLPAGWQLGAAAQYGKTKFKGASAAVPGFGARQDNLRLLQLQAHNRRISLAGFVPSLSLTREWQKSNSVFNQYQKTYAEINFIRQF